jgi:hypothetical protein
MNYKKVENTRAMLLILSIAGGRRQCFVCDSGKREREKVEKHWFVPF